jgi:hypothetical protein
MLYDVNLSTDMINNALKQLEKIYGNNEQTRYEKTVVERLLKNMYKKGFHNPKTIHE